MFERTQLEEVASGDLRLVPKLQAELARELLTLREATAPQMAEVDALLKQASSSVCSSDSTFQALYRDQLANKLRTAILACEREKQRADELFKVYTESCMKHGVVLELRGQEIESLTDERDKLLEKIAAYECEEGV
jgi:hypothetical protein